MPATSFKVKGYVKNNGVAVRPYMRHRAGNTIKRLTKQIAKDDHRWGNRLRASRNKDRVEKIRKEYGL